MSYITDRAKWVCHFQFWLNIYCVGFILFLGVEIKGKLHCMADALESITDFSRWLRGKVSWLDSIKWRLSFLTMLRNCRATWSTYWQTLGWYSLTEQRKVKGNAWRILAAMVSKIKDACILLWVFYY